MRNRRERLQKIDDIYSKLEHIFPFLFMELKEVLLAYSCYEMSVNGVTLITYTTWLGAVIKGERQTDP